MGCDSVQEDGIGALVSGLPKILSLLLKWYGAQKRDLPWRHTGDPYPIWLSEVMLQQTKVATVLPYYHRFLARYPDLHALAVAHEDDVLRLWQGLGYYQRARHLVPAARLLLSLGEWPRTVEGLAAMPGVGRSTAGAIASFAFGIRAPILDGNVRRVWWRLGALPLAAGQRSDSVLWTISEAAVSMRDPAQVNQALMELGATRCTHRTPACSRCPVARHCEARRLGQQERFPPRKESKPKPRLDVSLALIFRGDEFLVAKRPSKGLLGGLWELPGGKWEPGESAEAAVVREIREELGVEIDVGRAFPPVAHAYTHFSVRLHPFVCHMAANQKPVSSQPLRWIKREQIPDLAFPTGTLKVFDSVWSDERRAAEQPPTWE